MIQNRMRSQVHNDGVVKIYSVSDASESGGMPTQRLDYKCLLNYRSRTVGLQRQNYAMQDGVEISMLLRCPYLDAVSTQDIAIPIDGKQYKIRRIQRPEDIEPPVMDLELARLEADYEISE